MTSRVSYNKLGSTGHPGEEGEMAVREGFLEEVISKLTLERASENLGGVRRVGDREFQIERAASTKVLQGAAGEIGVARADQ